MTDEEKANTERARAELRLVAARMGASLPPFSVAQVFVGAGVAIAGVTKSDAEIARWLRIIADELDVAGKPTVN